MRKQSLRRNKSLRRKKRKYKRRRKYSNKKRKYSRRRKRGGAVTKPGPSLGPSFIVDPTEADPRGLRAAAGPGWDNQCPRAAGVPMGRPVGTTAPPSSPVQPRPRPLVIPAARAVYSGSPILETGRDRPLSSEACREQSICYCTYCGQEIGKTTYYARGKKCCSDNCQLYHSGFLSLPAEFDPGTDWDE